MARIFVDVSVFGSEWFRKLVLDLLKSPHVRVSYSEVGLLLGEHERTKKAREFYKLMGEQGRRDDAEPDAVEYRIRHLESLPKWQKEEACDDPHIFGLRYEKPFDYLFTQDADIATCRKCMVRVLDARYRSFRLICNDKNYRQHRGAILG